MALTLSVRNPQDNGVKNNASERGNSTLSMTHGGQEDITTSPATETVFVVNGVLLWLVFMTRCLLAVLAMVPFARCCVFLRRMGSHVSRSFCSL